MTIQDFNGEAGIASRYSTNGGSPDDWRIQIIDALEEEDFPTFQVEFTIGNRWGRHEYINFGFDVRDLDDPEKRKDLERLRLEFYNFKQTVDLAYNWFEDAAKKVLGELSEAE